MERINHWIGGKVVPGSSGRTGPVFNPATGEQTHEVDLASPEEVGSAVDAAADAFPAWRSTSLSKRADILFRIRELLEQRKPELARIVKSSRPAGRTRPRRRSIWDSHGRDDGGANDGS